MALRVCPLFMISIFRNPNVLVNCFAICADCPERVYEPTPPVPTTIYIWPFGFVKSDVPVLPPSVIIGLDGLAVLY